MKIAHAWEPQLRQTFDPLLTTITPAPRPIQISGGGLVPLSHAICCRPCLPTEIPPQSDPPDGMRTSRSARTALSSAAQRTAAGRASLPLSPDDPRWMLSRGSESRGNNGSIPASPVAVISIGCHPSSGRVFRALQCEEDGNSFVAGGKNRHRPYMMHHPTHG